MGEVVAVTNETFESEVLKSDVPVLVDFWAAWCGPCRAVAPIVEAVAKAFDGRLKAVKVNVDENRELAGKYGIQSIPTLFIFKGGQIADSIIGYVSEKELRKRLESHLPAA